MDETVALWLPTLTFYPKSDRILLYGTLTLVGAIDERRNWEKRIERLPESQRRYIRLGKIGAGRHFAVSLRGMALFCPGSETKLCRALSFEKMEEAVHWRHFEAPSKEQIVFVQIDFDGEGRSQRGS